MNFVWNLMFALTIFLISISMWQVAPECNGSKSRVETICIRIPFAHFFATWIFSKNIFIHLLSMLKLKITLRSELCLSASCSCASKKHFLIWCNCVASAGVRKLACKYSIVRSCVIDDSGTGDGRLISVIVIWFSLNSLANILFRLLNA